MIVSCEYSTPCNALGNSASQLQSCCRQRSSVDAAVAVAQQRWLGSHRRRCCRHHVSTAINGTVARIRTLCCILTVTVTSTLEWQEGLLSAKYRLFASVDLRIFTSLTRWKFPYENRLVEISRESYDILVCK